MTCVTSKCGVCDRVHFCQFHHCIVVAKVGQRFNHATSDSFSNLFPGQIICSCTFSHIGDLEPLHKQILCLNYTKVVILATPSHVQANTRNISLTGGPWSKKRMVYIKCEQFIS